ncbi:MAG: hypothetical protein ACRETK_07335, partial [Steroidobacteraceae bacterium]
MPDRSTAPQARLWHRAALAAALLALGTLVSTGTPAFAQKPGGAQQRSSVQQRSTQRITPNFTNVDITQIIQAVSMATGKNFIIDPRVRAQV